MRIVRLVVAVLIIVALVAWIRAAYRFEWRELLPFRRDRSFGLYDLVAVAMIAIAAVGARRIVQGRGE